MLTPEEENLIVLSIKSFCELSQILLRSIISDAVHVFVENLLSECQKKLSFNNNRPDRTFVSLIISRHDKQIKMGRKSKEEEVRFWSHIDKLYHLTRSYNLEGRYSCEQTMQSR